PARRGAGRADGSSCRIKPLRRSVLHYLEQAPAFLLDDQRGEQAAAEGAGIDIDPVAAEFGRRAGRVAMDDDRRVRIPVFEKGRADPLQVVDALRLEPNARPYPGMTEEVVAKVQARLQFA